MIDDIQAISLGHHQSQRSTVDCLLAMQQEEWTDLKRFDWMKNLTCLTLDRPWTSSATWNGSPFREDFCTLYEIQADIFDSQDLHIVTVSYSWTAARHHSSKEGAYRVVGLAGDIRAVRVRNTVMRRAVQFVSHHGLRGFWIDRECLDQEDKISHRRSMQSMDRLYAISPISVGLVDAVINEQWKLDTLRELLSGSMVARLGKGENTQESLNDIWEGIKWFSRLLSDRWWRRAWIFQEEYCAARRMRLLIRCYRNLKRPSTTDLGTMLDEVEISAIDFRERLTELYWKCRHGFKLTPKQLHFFQKHVLRRAERYSRTYAERPEQRAQALSTILVSDLLKRDLCRPTDLLAISANCCAYSRRLNQPKLESTGDNSIALALFSQALLNGEVLYNQAKFTSSPCWGFAEFFRRHIFRGITPPTTVRNLTFTKHCRFSEVSLTQEGVTTKGHLWRVVERLKAPYTSRCLGDLPRPAAP